MTEPVHISEQAFRDVAADHDEIAEAIAAARGASSEIYAAVNSYGPIMHQFKEAVADILEQREAALLEHDNRHRLAADALRREGRNYTATDEDNARRLQL